ncbi:MAG: SLC13 family permease, partial [Acidobacteria bacterium]|nr:SLC13 family permease [Acidobacteriota bacterium]
MSPIAITLILLLVAVVLFASEKIPVDVVGILLVIGLVMTNVLTIQEGLSGFGDNIIITIGGLFVLTGGLVKTGIVDLIGRRLYRISGSNEFLLTALIMAVAAICASVLKNTTTTAMFLPVVLGLAHRAKISPSKLLMPLAFGAILGGSCTLIGTSTNLAVSGAMQRYGMQPYSMFELTPVGIITVAVGLIYMLFVGRKLLPARGGEESLTEQYSIREYVSEVLVLPASHLIGKTLGEANINLELDLTVLGIIRGEEQKIAPSPNEPIEEGDLLIVEGKLADILNVKSEAGLEIR